MAKLTYDDFKQRLNIQDVLVDAGYTLNRGLFYDMYILYLFDFQYGFY